MYKGGLLIAIASSSRMVVLLNCGWMTYKSQLVLISLLHTYMKYVLLLSIWLGHLKWQPAV